MANFDPASAENRPGCFGKEWDGREKRLRTITDSEVIASSGDDPDLFGAIFERHFPEIHRYLHRRVGLNLAEDLAAETFVVAFRRRASYDTDQEDARPWLFGIATNLLRRHQRSERRQLLAFARRGTDPVAASDPALEATDERVQAEAAWPHLAEALAALKPGDREVLLLYAWTGLSYQEVALALRVPVGTVRSRLARARRVVRELIAGCGTEHGWEGANDE